MCISIFIEIILGVNKLTVHCLKTTLVCTLILVHNIATYFIVHLSVEISNYLIFLITSLLIRSPGGVVIINIPASPLPIELVATTENV